MRMSASIYDHLVHWCMVNLIFRTECSIYEIYPQSKTPHLSQIADLDFNISDSEDPPNCLFLPGLVFWYSFNEDEARTVFRVWDYRLNHSISFSAAADFIGYHVYFVLCKTLELASDSFVGR